MARQSSAIATDRAKSARGKPPVALGREGGAMLCSALDVVVHVGDTVLALEDSGAL
jgi:hypothetical protein